MTGQNKALGPWPLGVDNRKADHALTQAQGNVVIDLLRSATNVDITDEGRLRRRGGFALALAGQNVHSLWSDGGPVGFCASGQRLLQLDEQLVATEIRADLIPGQPLSFCEAGGTYFYTGGGQLGMVRDGARLDFTPAPRVVPALDIIAGALPAGRYQLCFTHLGAGGESAATPIQEIALAEPGGISISTIPAAETLLAYMTGPDGEVLGRVGRVDGTVDIVAPPALGARCQTVNLAPMPAGSIVRFSNGRLLVAAGNLLVYSEPFGLGLTNPSKNYIPFPAPITVVEPCGTGVFVAADKTYWIEGEITQASLVVRLPYGGVAGSGARDPLSPETALWISDRGLVVGTADGTATAVQEPRLLLAGGAAGATLRREREGMQHVVTAVRDPMGVTGACSSYFEAEIIRKGSRK